MVLDDNLGISENRKDRFGWEAFGFHMGFVEKIAQNARGRTNSWPPEHVPQKEMSSNDHFWRKYVKFGGFQSAPNDP